MRVTHAEAERLAKVVLAGLATQVNFDWEVSREKSELTINVTADKPAPGWASEGCHGRFKAMFKVELYPRMLSSESTLKRVLKRIVVKNCRFYVIPAENWKDDRNLQDCIGDHRSCWHRLAPTFQAISTNTIKVDTTLMDTEFD